MSRVRLAHAWDALRSKLWLIPVLGLLAGVGLSFATLGIDRAGDYKLVSHSLTGGPTAVHYILSTTASSLLSLTSLVLTLTLVVIQLAMGQFSPRIVGSLLQNRFSQLAVALFLATFAYTILVLRDVDDKTNHVPGVSVLLSYVLTLVSVATLLLFVHHVGQSLRVGGMIDLVGNTTRDEIERVYPEVEVEPPVPEDVITTPASGNVVLVHREAAVAAARAEGCVLELIPAMGDYVPEGGQLLRVHGKRAADVRADVTNLVRLGSERTHLTDPGYGIRKLVDIAARSVATSPFDDPTTAVQALHRIHECMRKLVVSRFPDGRYRDEEGELRFVMRVLEWEGYVQLSFEEVRLAGACSPQVARRLRAALEDLLDHAPAERRPPLERQLALLERDVRREIDDQEDVKLALVPDVQGIGSGPDVMPARANGDLSGSTAPASRPR
jgi:uncharacterized membrane protein